MPSHQRQGRRSGGSVGQTQSNPIHSTKADPRGSRVRLAMAGRGAVAEGGWIRDPVAHRAHRRIDFFGYGAANTVVCGQI
jgi:hypothetical protein